MVTKNLPEPPEKLSELIRLAVKDARSLDRNDYYPHFNYYHAYFDDTRPLLDGNGDAIDPVDYNEDDPPMGYQCFVCNAGAIISGELGADLLTNCDPSCYPKWMDCLKAVDMVRYGYYGSAAAWMRMPQSIVAKVYDAHIPPPVHDDFIGWDEFDLHLDDLELVSDQLENIGA